MADFRKWLLAFAVVALVLGTGLSLQAQGTTSGLPNGGQMTCTTTSVPVLDRAEGFTELVGDIVISCTGGTPTGVGTVIQTADFRVGLNTNITSRIFPNNGDTVGTGTGYVPSEALLLVDNPFPTTPNPATATFSGNSPPFSLCPSLTGCNAWGTGGAVSPYDNRMSASNGGHTNVYSAYEGVYVCGPTQTTCTSTPASGGATVISGFNAIDFLGVPVDAPGTNLARVIRITNIRADAVGRAGGAAGVVGSIPIVAFVSIGGALSNVTITNSQPTVAYVVPGIVVSSSSGLIQQCTEYYNQPGLTVTEGFAYAFKPRISPGTLNGAGNPNTALPQNVPGYTYFTESGYSLTTTAGDIGVADSGTRFIVSFSNIQNGVNVSLPTVITGSGSLVLQLVSSASGASTTGAGGISPGTSTTGASTFSTTGTYSGGTTGTTAYAVYEVVQANGNAIESFSVPFSVSFAGSNSVATNTPYATPQGVSDLLSAAAGFSTVSVWFAPSTTAAAAVTNNNNAWNIGQPPYSGTYGAGADQDWIPRFVNSSSPQSFLTVSPCTCNLLYPYVTSATGYDTGIAIANTSMDPFGGVGAAGNTPGFDTTIPSTPPLSGICGDCVSPAANSVSTDLGETGTVQFWFFGNSTNTSAKEPTLFQLPEAGSTSVITVPAGCTFAFEMTSATQAPAQTLTGCGTAQTATGGLAAGNYTVNATSATTPLMGFTGYVIATANFQYCHGLAYILPTGTGAPIGGMYLAIELDTPQWAASLYIGDGGYVYTGGTRTHQIGESQGH